MESVYDLMLPTNAFIQTSTISCQEGPLSGGTDANCLNLWGRLPSAVRALKLYKSVLLADLQRADILHNTSSLFTVAESAETELPQCAHKRL